MEDSEKEKKLKEELEETRTQFFIVDELYREAENAGNG